MWISPIVTSTNAGVESREEELPLGESFLSSKKPIDTNTTDFNR